MQCIRILFFPLFTVCFANWVVDDLGCVTPEDEAGICTSLSDCNIVLDLIKYPDYSSQEDQDTLTPYRCGVDGNGRLKVCCPLLTEEKSSVDDHSHHKNIQLLPKNCGRVQAWGIYNGNKSDIFEFGWSALLKYAKAGDRYLCGGTLINDRYILTAAHCIQNKFKLIGVRLGEFDVSTDKDCTEEYTDGKFIEICAPPPQDFDVSLDDATVHPKYDSRTYKHNIALIRLRYKADIRTESVGPICLPITKAEKTIAKVQYTAIGWGATEYGIGSHVKVKVVTHLVTNSKCRNFYMGVDNHVVSNEQHICTDGNGDFCTGDYGGTLMGYYTDNDGLKTIQYGVVSIRPPTCQVISAPTVHTKVPSYVGWILDNIEP